MKISIIAILILSFSFTVSAKTKTGYFSFQKILEQSKFGKKLTKDSENEQKAKIKSLDLLKAELEKNYNTVMKQKSLLTQEALLRKQSEFSSQEQIINLKAKKLAQEQSVADKERYVRLDKEVYIYAKRLAKKLNMSAIYEESQKPFYSEDISDITDELLQLMNN